MGTPHGAPVLVSIIHTKPIFPDDSAFWPGSDIRVRPNCALVPPESTLKHLPHVSSSS